MPSIDIQRSNTSQFQQNLDRIFDPLNRASDRSLAMTISEEERKKRLKDMTDAELRAEKRAKESEDRQEQRIRRQKLMELSMMGIDLPKDATDKQIAEAQTGRFKKRAELVVGSYESERKQNEEEYDKTFNELISVSSSKASIEEKRAAAKLMLRSPDAVKHLKPKEIAAIEHAIIDGDPEPIIEAAAKRVGKKGWFSDSPELGEAVLMAYYTPLAESESLTKQVKFQAITSKLKDLSNEKLQITRSLNQAYRDHGEYLDDATRARLKYGDQPMPEDAPMIPLGKDVPNDPADAFKNKPAPEAQPAPAPTTGEVMAKEGAIGVARRIDPRRIPGVSQVISGINAFIPGTEENQTAAAGIAALPAVAGQFLTGDRNAMPITDQELLQNRMERDARMNNTTRRTMPPLAQVQAAKVIASLRKNPNPKPLPITPELAEKIKAIVKQQYNGDPSGFDQFMKDVNSGDTTKIATFNLLVEEAMSQGSDAIPMP